MGLQLPACVVFGVFACLGIFGSGEAHAAGKKIYLVGDSTMRTERDGREGWGDALAPWLPKSAVAVENHARGGTSTRSFRELGYWKTVCDVLRPGDVVLIQFGHNDQGDPRDGKATLAGTGANTVSIKGRNSTKTTVHSYGWYLDRYLEEIVERKAIPVLVTPVPRNIWKNDKLVTAKQPQVQWARDVAAARHVELLDLNKLVVAHYQQCGRGYVSKRYFRGDDQSHTTREGAGVTARLAATALQNFQDERVRRAFGGK